MATQTADSADNLSNNDDYLLRHAPPGYFSDDPDFRSKMGLLAKRFFDFIRICFFLGINMHIGLTIEI